jgi:hypothetical protein
MQAQKLARICPERLAAFEAFYESLRVACADGSITAHPRRMKAR